jgi:hypothetical protein
LGIHDKNNAAEDFNRATYNSLESTLLWGGTGIEPLFNSYRASLRLGCARPLVRVSAVLIDPAVVDGFVFEFMPPTLNKMR